MLSTFLVYLCNSNRNLFWKPPDSNAFFQSKSWLFYQFADLIVTRPSRFKERLRAGIVEHNAKFLPLLLATTAFQIGDSTLPDPIEFLRVCFVPIVIMLHCIAMYRVPVVDRWRILGRRQYDFYFASFVRSLGGNRSVQSIYPFHADSSVASIEVYLVQVHLPNFTPIVLAAHASLVHHSPTTTVIVAPARVQLNGMQHDGLSTHGGSASPTHPNTITLKS